MNNDEFFHRLRRLIGRRCTFMGEDCMLIELLADEGMVILRCDESSPPIQRDQFGQALRRASETRQVAIFDTDGENLSADMLDLMTGLDGKAQP